MCDNDVEVIPLEVIPKCKNYQLGEYILVFFILISFFWIIGYSFSFNFLRRKTCRNIVKVGSFEHDENTLADPAKCFVFSIIASLIVIAIWWAFF
jgi:hypothetical protein